MKIAFVAPAYVPAFAFGGPVTQLQRITKALHKRGHDVAVYTTNAISPSSFVSLPSHEYIDGVLVKRYAVLLRVAGYWFSPSMLKDLLKDDFDVIHANCARSFQLDLASLVSRIKRVPLIVQSRGAIGSYRIENVVSFGLRFLYLLHNSILRISLKQADKVIALTQAEAAQYEIMGVAREKIEVIPNGIDLSEFYNLPKSMEFKKKFGINDEQKVILYLGRMDKIKGVDILIEAFARIRKEVGNVKLVIVGPDSEYSLFCRKLVRKFAIDENVLFTGPLYNNDKLEAYVDADVCVLPSRYETFSNVLLEAYACSKPVIASKVEAMQDLVVDGKTGILFPPEDVNALARALNTILGDSYRARQVGKEGFSFVSENFTIEKVVNKLEAVYQKAREWK